MKHIYIVLLLVGTNLISAQDTRLFENTWYLTKIVSNGIDYLPPTNTEVSSIGLTFNQQNNTISTNACNTFSSEVVFGNNFTFSIKGGAATLRLCFIQNNNLYESVYFNFLIENNPNNNFSYTINENQTVKTLTINSSSNKQAIYTNQNLSTFDSEELDFKVFFDTSRAILNIELNNQNTENIKVELFDSLGKIRKNESFSTTQIKISTADLSTGIYVVKITVNNQIAVKKFIKL